MCLYALPLYSFLKFNTSRDLPHCLKIPSTSSPKWFSRTSTMSSNILGNRHPFSFSRHIICISNNNKRKKKKKKVRVKCARMMLSKLLINTSHRGVLKYENSRLFFFLLKSLFFIVIIICWFFPLISETCSLTLLKKSYQK